MRYFLLSGASHSRLSILEPEITVIGSVVLWALEYLRSNCQYDYNINLAVNVLS